MFEQAVIFVCILAGTGFAVWMFLDVSSKKEWFKNEYERATENFFVAVDIFDAIRNSGSIEWLDGVGEDEKVIVGTMDHDTEGLPGLWMVNDGNITTLGSSEEVISERTRELTEMMAERVGQEPLEFLGNVEDTFEEFDARHIEPFFYEDEGSGE